MINYTKEQIELFDDYYNRISNCLTNKVDYYIDTDFLKLLDEAKQNGFNGNYISSQAYIKSDLLTQVLRRALTVSRKPKQGKEDKLKILEEAANKLLDMGADVVPSWLQGEDLIKHDSPLQWCVSQGFSIDLLKRFLDKGNYPKETLSKIALWPMMQIMIMKQNDPEFKDYKKIYLEKLTLLMKYGADPCNRYAYGGWSSIKKRLMNAAEQNNGDLTERSAGKPTISIVG